MEELWEPRVVVGEPRLDDLFPVKGAIPEELQIGREIATKDLTERLASGDDALIIEARRTGKSSMVVGGVLKHLHQIHDAIVAQADLRVAGITDAAGLADVLIQTAAETGAKGKSVSKQQAGRASRRVKDAIDGERARAGAKLAGEDGKLATTQTLLTLLTGSKQPGLKRLQAVIEALEHHAAEHENLVVIFVDEVQDLALEEYWSPDEGLAVQKALAQAMRKTGRRVVFAFAGSEKSTMEHLFKEGQPLYREGQRYELPPISTEDWTAGLIARYAEDDRVLSKAGALRILDASEGHPLRTMQICRRALQAVRQQQTSDVTLAIIDEAIKLARQHFSWDGRP